MPSELNLPPVDLPADAVEVGRITSAWGVQGWFKVLTWPSATPSRLTTSSPIRSTQ